MNLEKILSDQNVKKILEDFSSIRKDRSSEISLTNKKLASFIDHTLLKPDATIDELKTLCEEAAHYNFASVCVNSSNTDLCIELLKESNIKVCTVIGFPLGASLTSVKGFEAEEAINYGAEEIDMVLNIGKLKQDDYDYVLNEIQKIVLIAKRNLVLCKVILETCLLNDEEKVRACLICNIAGAHYVKTSTGFSKGGATLRDVALMKFVVGDFVKVKASGGIKSFDDAKAMIAAGAQRLGTSSGVKIMQGLISDSNY